MFPGLKAKKVPSTSPSGNINKPLDRGGLMGYNTECLTDPNTTSLLILLIACKPIFFMEISDLFPT